MGAEACGEEGRCLTPEICPLSQIRAGVAVRIKQHGARAAVQLQHAGKVAVCDIAAGRPMLVPSIPHNSRDEMSAALTPEEHQKNFNDAIRKSLEQEKQDAKAK